jgi:hypothetical protein
MTNPKLNPRIVCKDGTSLSVQANEYAYCTPRISGYEWTSYQKVEVGFVENDKGERITMPDEWLPYADDGTNQSDVYGYVPIELVQAFIDEHSK